MLTLIHEQMNERITVFAQVDYIKGSCIQNRNAPAFLSYRAASSSPFLRRGRQLWAVIFLSLFCGNAPAQTTVVAVRTPTEIVVGADSKGLAGDVTTSRSMCKIGHVGNFLFAYAGHGGDTVTGFNPAAVATKAGNTQGTILEKARRFEAEVKEPLVVSLTLLRQINPRLYKVVAEDVPPLQAIFFGAEKGVPVLYEATFKSGVSASGAVEVGSSIKEVAVGPSADRNVVVLGQRRDIDSILIAYPNFWGIGLVDGVRWLVRLEAITQPLTVGTPVDLVRLDKSGVRWIQRKPECEEKKGAEPRSKRARRG
ncbi:MAG: hypothetical protein H7Z38_18365 [Rubrivivax sp.]|nr:hypothetical protein [Pyrinomonadaceae bacterium]